MPLPRITTAARRAASSRRGMRKAAIAVSTAILTLGPGAVAATADPGRTSDLPPDLVTAVQRDLRISPSEYLHRADVAQQVAGFATNARRDYPESFAGAWLDPNGKPIVGVASGAGADQARADAQAAGFTVRTVAKSEEQLRGEKTAFEHWLDTQPPAVANLVRGAVIDTVNNSIAVRVDKPGLPLPSFIDPARVVVMAPPVAGEGIKAGSVAATTPGRPLAGGDGYASVSAEHSLRCSFGFNGTDRNGNVVNITAGHCNPNAENGGKTAGVSVNELLPGDQVGPQLATFQKSVLGAQDYSIMRIAGGAVNRFANNSIRGPGGAPVNITGVATPVVGAPVCKSGARTGFSCGVVNAVDQTVQVGDRQMKQGFSANICALPGDSGGPMVTGTQALGISSASSVADFPVCDIPNVLGMLTGNAPQLFGQPLDVVLSDNPGLRVRTS